MPNWKIPVSEYGSTYSNKPKLDGSDTYIRLGNIEGAGSKNISYYFDDTEQCGILEMQRVQDVPGTVVFEAHPLVTNLYTYMNNIKIPIIKY